MLCQALHLKGAGCSAGDPGKEVLLCGFFLYTLFSEKEQKNTSLGEFPSCEIHSGKQSLPTLALAGVFLCLIRTRITCCF